MQNFLNDLFYSSLLTESNKFQKISFIRKNSQWPFELLLFTTPHFKKIFYFFLISPRISILPVRNAKINLNQGRSLKLTIFGQARFNWNICNMVNPVLLLTGRARQCCHAMNSFYRAVVSMRWAPFMSLCIICAQGLSNSISVWRDQI